jgi:hypothetical protein
MNIIGQSRKGFSPATYNAQIARAEDKILASAKITLRGDDPPGHSGWQGYAHHVDVFLDGKKIGELVGTGHNKRQLEYFFRGEPTKVGQIFATSWPKIVGPVGIRASRAMLAKLLHRATLTKPPE